MNRNEMVVHHNYLNESKFTDFTELELNLFITILYKMRHEKENEVTFKSEDIKNMTNAKDRSYKEFERILHSLQDRTFYLKTIDGYERIKPFPTLIFNNEKKKITVEVNKRMVPVFRQLKEQFTQYSLKEFVSLDNKYGKRLYQLLKQYESIGKRNFKLDNFRELLDCTNKSYDKMSNLDKKVLMKARDDINEKTSLNVDYVKLKKGRKIESVEFTIKKSDKTTLSDYKDTPSDKLINLKLDIGKISKTKDLSNERSSETKGIKKDKTTLSDKSLKQEIKGKAEKQAAKKKVIKKDKTTPSDYKDTLSDKLEKAILKAKRNIYVSKAWNKRVDNKINKILNENDEKYTLDILNRLYTSVKQDIKTTLVQYINGIMKNIRIEVKEKVISSHNFNKVKEEKTSNKEEVKGNKLLPKENKEENNEEMTLEEFEKLDDKRKEKLEKEAIILTMKKVDISEKFLSDLKKKSLKIYFNTIKASIKIK
ncbi:MAG: replication initiation protein [Psychrilyobacter sp.]|uniref:replication initiation protein n=1 Tax=Psychrilyobacter sp. TaxID=2586924 RepID=UPI003C724430